MTSVLRTSLLVSCPRSSFLLPSLVQCLFSVLARKMRSLGLFHRVGSRLARSFLSKPRCPLQSPHCVPLVVSLSTHDRRTSNSAFSQQGLVRLVAHSDSCPSPLPSSFLLPSLLTHSSPVPVPCSHESDSVRKYPVGISDFKEIVQEGYFHWDRTPFVKEFYEDAGEVLGPILPILLILRPF